MLRVEALRARWYLPLRMKGHDGGEDHDGVDYGAWAKADGSQWKRDMGNVSAWCEARR